MLFTLLFLAQPALAAEQALTDCREIEGVAERVACYDKIVDSQFAKDSTASVATSKPPKLSKSEAVPDAQTLFGTNDAEAKRIVEMSLAIEQIDQIEAVLTDVRKSVSRKLTLTLDNGQIWRQIDGQQMRLNNSEEVIIRRASLGSYLLEKRTGGRRIRVKRAN